MIGDAMAIAACLARRLRLIADRLDHRGAPKATHLWFTFERGQGLVINEDGDGCRLWYLGDDSYAKAHDASMTRHNNHALTDACDSR